jgi:hypothetical protein
MSTDIDRFLVTALIQDPLHQLPGVAEMSCGPDRGSQQYDPGLLGGHVNATGASLVAGKVTFPVGAEAAEVAEGHVEWAIPFKKREIPVPQRGEGWKWGRTYGICPAFFPDLADGDIQIPDVPKSRIPFFDGEMHPLLAQDWHLPTINNNSGSSTLMLSFLTRNTCSMIRDMRPG